MNVAEILKACPGVHSDGSNIFEIPTWVRYYVEGTNMDVLRKLRNSEQQLQLLTTLCVFHPLLRDLRQTSTERFVKPAVVPISVARTCQIYWCLESLCSLWQI